MKKIFMSFFLVLVISSVSAIANDETEVSNNTKESFKKQFVGVESVEWKNNEGYEIATFVFNGYHQEAFFTTSGEFAGVARFLEPSQLPMEVMRSIGKRFADAGLTKVIEVYNQEGTFYWLTAEVKSELYRVKIGTYGAVLSVTKLKK